MLNSLKYVKKLEEAGVCREQAETHILGTIVSVAIGIAVTLTKLVT